MLPGISRALSVDGLQKKSLEVSVAERASFKEVVVGLDFFGEQAHTVAIGFGTGLRAVAIGDGGARRRVAGAEVDFEEFCEGQERLPFGMADVIVERERVAFVAEIGAELDDFLRRRDAFEDFEDDLVGREKTRGAALERQEIEIDKGFRVTSERLEAEERSGVHDQDFTRRFVGSENVLAGGPEQEFVSEEFQLVVEDGLASNEFFEHAISLSR